MLIWLAAFVCIEGSQEIWRGVKIVSVTIRAIGFIDPLVTFLKATMIQRRN
jgi:hypothetical protein